MAAARFFGSFEHSLDDKGRVILPVKFRSPFEHGGYLARDDEGCLALWAPEEFEAQMVAKQEMAASGVDARNAVRRWARWCHEVEVDRQGRMPIPVRLRELARLTGDVLVVGAIDRVELWDPGTWEERVEPGRPVDSSGDGGLAP